MMRRGDIVRLSTIAGPDMVIEHEAAGTDVVGCMWFDKDHRLCQGNFFKSLLEKSGTKH